HSRHNELEASFIKFAGKHLAEPYSSDKKLEFKNELLGWDTLCRSGEKKIMIEYIDILSWVESIYENSSLEEILSNKKNSET
ncbi:MAG: hypothetical protein JKY09_09150, partial [Crocinitomicaceae bacterium]|nr:hypothetical protein [Crocinitomicaceae bacterium]